VWYEPAEVENFLVVKCQVVEFQGLCLAYSWILLLYYLFFILYYFIITVVTDLPLTLGDELSVTVA